MIKYVKIDGIHCEHCIETIFADENELEEFLKKYE